jgi:L-asparaginase
MSMVYTNLSQDPKRVLVLSTGGTLGMRPGGEGELEPDQVLQDLQTWLPELSTFAQIDVEILENIDSTYITPNHWIKLALRIERAQNEKQHAGIVVLHGTDTLAFTASALSFLLPHLKLPVVVTGAQKPLAIPRTDARNNILGAVEAALAGPIEIMVFFHHKAFRGNRVTKTAISEFDGFDSANYPALGSAGTNWTWDRDLFWSRQKRPTVWQSLPKSLPSSPFLLPWLPGIDFTQFESVLEKQWAVIFEAYGSGNLPLEQEAKNLVIKYIERGGLLFIRSQVPRGGVNLGTYAPGKALARLGIVSCSDMTRETAVTKLMVLKAMGLDNTSIKAQMTTSLVGELNEPD